MQSWHFQNKRLGKPEDSLTRHNSFAQQQNYKINNEVQNYKIVNLQAYKRHSLMLTNLDTLILTLTYNLNTFELILTSSLNYLKINARVICQ